MTTTTNRNETLDRLALGSDCPRCGAYADDACETRRNRQPTAPHSERIDRAVRQYQATKA